MIQLHVYFSAPVARTAEKLKFKVPTGNTKWLPLVKSKHGEFGIEEGFYFKLKPTKEALDSIVPVLNDVLQPATKKRLHFIVEYNESDKHLAAIVHAWRARLIEMGYVFLNG